MKPCKYLDYDEKNYSQCKLKFVDEENFPGVKYWDRFEGGFIQQWELDRWPNTAIKVQFCKLKGRIAGIFQCYNSGGMNCYKTE